MKLSSESIDLELKNLKGWRGVNNKMHKEFESGDFNQAFGFMTRAVMHIEKMIIIRNSLMSTIR